MGLENCTNGLSPVGKPYNRPGGRGNAPLLVAGATTFPPAGGLYSSLCVELTKRGFAVFYSAPCIGVAREHESHQRTYFEGTQ